MLALAKKVRRELKAEEAVGIQNLDVQTILEPMTRREPRDYYSNCSSARLLRRSGGGTRFSPEVRNRLPERLVIDAADHISSFSDLEMKSKYSLAARGASEVSSWVGRAMVRRRHRTHAGDLAGKPDRRDRGSGRHGDEDRVEAVRAGDRGVFAAAMIDRKPGASSSGLEQVGCFIWVVSHTLDSCITDFPPRSRGISETRIGVALSAGER